MRRHALPRALLVTALFSPAVAWGASTEAPQNGPQPANQAANQPRPNQLAAPPAKAEQGLRGRVSADAAPLARATVYAYELAQLTVQKAVTGGQGEFRFDQLPSGVYKLIAFKPGYEPAVLMLSRAAAEALQFVELKLAQENTATQRTKDGEGFWAVRDQIPADILRDLQGVQLAEMSLPPLTQVPASDFHTDVTASTGVSNLAGQGESQVAGGGIGMEGKIGPVSLDVRGEFWRMASGDGEMGMGGGDGKATALAVRMEAKGEGQIDFTTVSQRIAETSTASADDADFERYRVSWSQPFGERSRSRFLAQYTSQSNFFRPGVAASMPNESRALNLEGAYQIEMTERSSLETGLRYRQGELAYASTGDGYDDPQRALELFGKAGWQMRPSVLVEYGLFTQMRDGSLALAPQGGVVIQLGDSWQAVASASHRVETGEVGRPLDGVSPLRFSQAGRGCQDIEQHCYRVLLARQSDHDGLFAVSAVDREMAETLNLYFDDDILGHLESLYLVQGDRLPEAQVVVQRRVSPRVLARLESTYADGGGGIIYAVDDSAYENRVRYLVTSVDTRFQRTDTGVFVAFHHLEQGMEPVGANGTRIAPMELERLQLMLSQDLNVLLRLAADWSVHLDFEVSRGALPFTLRDPEADDVRRRFTGGLSVKF